MAEDDEAQPKRKPAHAVGDPLDQVSIEEIDARIAVLREEIRRLEEAREKKSAAKSAADAFFKK